MCQVYQFDIYENTFIYMSIYVHVFMYLILYLNNKTNNLKLLLNDLDQYIFLTRFIESQPQCLLRVQIRSYKRQKRLFSLAIWGQTNKFSHSVLLHASFFIFCHVARFPVYTHTETHSHTHTHYQQFSVKIRNLQGPNSSGS